MLILSDMYMEDVEVLRASKVLKPGRNPNCLSIMS